jgi:predicted nucleic acid-binding protein
MKFPLSEINRQEYIDDIFELIVDNDCVIFVDTNIFALFFRINNLARNEFFDWIKTLIKNDRIKTPLWALNEYSDRFIRNKIEDYYGPLKSVKSIKNNFEELDSFLKMNIDSESISKSSYESLDDFKEELDLVKKKLNKINKVAKTKNESYKLKIHSEIKAIFEKTVLESDLKKVIKTTRNEGKFRFNHRIPPGFEDKEKDLNSFGDLIIWNEILNFCNSKNVKKGILITNDLKKDWVYAPNRLIENTSKTSLTNKHFKIVDPRLVYEFKSKTGSEDFHIISFDTLVQILLQKTNLNFIELAKALQIESVKESKEGKSKKNGETDIEEDILKTDDNKVSKSTETNENQQEEIEGTQELNYEETALADRDFPLNDSSFLTETITKLKSYNWYVQNPAIDKLLDYPESKIEKNIGNKNKLFVLGRNIYQAAQGGSASASDYIYRLRSIFTKYSDFYTSHLFTGMLYEVYFDSSNTFREYMLKSNFIDELYALEDNSRLRHSFDKIVEFLEPHTQHLLYLPHQEGEGIEIVIETKGEVKTVESDWGDNMNTQLISSIKANNKELLTNNDDLKIQNFLSFDLKISSLLEIISNVYGIPLSKINNSSDLDEDVNLMIGAKGFKKLA